MNFTVVYQFLCPNCKFINSGKKTVQADDAEQASHALATAGVTCRNCHQSVTCEVEAQTVVFTSTDQELADSGIGPAAPRT